MKPMRLLAPFTAIIMALTACTIEPPLHLPAETVVVDLPIVITDLEVVWSLNVDWESEWFYPWEQEDIDRWGELSYPMPRSYEIRRYFLGSRPGSAHTTVDGTTLLTTTYRSKYDFGYYDLLAWSNIYSPDQTQVVVIDDSNLDYVWATTTRSRYPLNIPALKDQALPHNHPEIFYSAYEQDVHISNNKEDYDYYDEVENVWVKHLKCEMQPLVFIYLVQVIVHNNSDGRIVGPSQSTVITGVASGVNVTTGATGHESTNVIFDMRMKKDLPYRNGARADIMGGKLTTFGLCDMPSWSRSRGQAFAGRADVDNYMMLGLHFINGADSTFVYPITDQMRRQPHGGIITIEILADTITVPIKPGGGGGGSMFDPNVNPYEPGDTTEIEI